MGQKKHKYPVCLSAQERAELNQLTMQGSTQVRKLKRAQILLLADEHHSQGQKTDKEIAAKLDIGTATIERIRRHYVETGLEAALNEKPRSGRPLVISGLERAKITALACSTPPVGHARWSLRLLAEKVVELEIVDTICYTSVGDILKKRTAAPAQSVMVHRRVDGGLFVSDGGDSPFISTALCSLASALVLR